MAEHRLVEGQMTRLRPAAWGFSEEELRRRYRWSLDDVLQYWSGTIPGARTFAQFENTVRERDWPRDGKRVSYGILTKHNELVGMVSCYNLGARDKSGELGVYLGEKQYWGQGLGTDAVIAFLHHLFRDLGLEAVYLHTYASNERARRSYVRVGFQVTEKRRRFSPRVGYHEEVKMTITRRDFERLHGANAATAAP